MKREKKDILLAGVGGQGIVSIAAVIAMAALKKGWHIKQSEVHGMSQRGGAVQSHLRISNEAIFSDLLSMGQTDVLLSVEPLEALRYLPYLSRTGTVITADAPFVNIEAYPPITEIRQALLKAPNPVIVDVTSLARESGNVKTSNMVMLGAAAQAIGIADALMEEAIADIFKGKGQSIVDVNIRAFRLGRGAVA